MKLVKLTDDLHVAASDVAEVTVNNNSATVTVRMKNGIGHSVGADYGKGVYDTRDRLVKEINDGMKFDIAESILRQMDT